MQTYHPERDILNTAEEKEVWNHVNKSLSIHDDEEELIFPIDDLLEGSSDNTSTNDNISEDEGFEICEKPTIMNRFVQRLNDWIYNTTIKAIIGNAPKLAFDWYIKRKWICSETTLIFVALMIVLCISYISKCKKGTQLTRIKKR
jgi:hypothetical protein